MSLNPHAREFVPKAFQAEPKSFQAEANAAPFFIPLAPPLPPTSMMHFRYDELQKMYNESQRELAALKRTNQTLKSEYDKMYDDLEQQKNNYYYLNTDYDELKAVYVTLESKYSGLKEAHHAICEDEDSLRMQIEMLQNKVVDLENKNNFLYKGMNTAKNKQILLEQEQLTYMKVRETSIVTINQMEASILKLEEENRALQESAALQQEELNSKVIHYEEKITDLQNRLSDAILRFIEKFQEVEKARSEAAYNAELAIHQKNLKAEEYRSMLELFQNATASFIEERAQWAQERNILQVTLNSLCANYEEKNGEVAYYNEIFQNYERRILELQAYKGIVSHLYTLPSKPTRRIMNPETDYDSEPEEAA